MSTGTVDDDETCLSSGLIDSCVVGSDDEDDDVSVMSLKVVGNLSSISLLIVVDLDVDTTGKVDEDNVVTSTIPGNLDVTSTVSSFEVVDDFEEDDGELVVSSSIPSSLDIDVDETTEDGD